MDGKVRFRKLGACSIYRLSVNAADPRDAFHMRAGKAQPRGLGSLISWDEVQGSTAEERVPTGAMKSPPLTDWVPVWPRKDQPLHGPGEFA